MKYFIATLSAMLLLAGCGEDEDVEIDGNLIQERGGVAYLPKEEDPFTGVAVFKYVSGQKEEEVTYKDGKEEGLCTYWYESGQKKRERTYKAGKRDGPFISWYESGQKRREGNAKDGKQDGLVTEWYSNGKKSGEFTFNAGELISSKEWDEEGYLR